ncbi:MAG: DUF192 domain-containing protein [Verrucomicrobiota bacterium]|nr:DUF192 domain-containing protein [Verrucomicrobiota bacterium]
MLLYALLAAYIELGGILLNVEIAQTPAQHEQGLMGRRELAEDSGMLFVFEQNQILQFWMKNTPLPLSVGFFDENRALINVADMAPNTLRIHRSKRPARYALELHRHWFRDHHIKPGMKFYFKDQSDQVNSTLLKGMNPALKDVE